MNQIFLEEFLGPLGISPAEFTSNADIPTEVLAALVNGKGSVTPALADRLSNALGTTPQFWINLQALHHEDPHDLPLREPALP